MNESVKQYLERYHNSKVIEVVYNPENISLKIKFENGEKTWLGFMTIEKITFLKPNYETFVEFYKEHLKNTNGGYYGFWPNDRTNNGYQR